MNIDAIRLRWGHLSPLTYRADRCGHDTKRYGHISAFGRISPMLLPRNKRGSVDYCLDCIGKMTIRCAWCDKPIFIGDPVTLYRAGSDFQVPEHAVVYTEDPLRLVGCLGWKCADIATARAGFWKPSEEGEGYVNLYEALHGARKPLMAVGGDAKTDANSALVPE